MNVLQLYKTFGPVDSKYIRRDDMSIMLLIAPVLLGIATRWVIPYIFQGIGYLIGEDILPYITPIMGYMLLILMPLFCGMIIGLLLLDHVDDHTIQGIQVSPVSMSAYMAYRLATPMAFSLLMTLLVYPISGLQPIDFLSLLGCALLAMPFAPLLALIFATIAENKIQGMVVMKASGGILILPVLAYFLTSNWKFIVAIVPTFWPGQFYWMSLAGDPNRWIIFVLGMGIETGLIILFRNIWLKKISS